jgi:hypothetical protein
MLDGHVHTERAPYFLWGFLVSAPRCTRLFRALWHVAVLATYRPCCVAVVDDVAEPRTTHALPALAQRNPSGPAPTLRRCSSISEWPTRTGASATTNFTSNGHLRKSSEERGARNEETRSGQRACPRPTSLFLGPRSPSGRPASSMTQLLDGRDPLCVSPSPAAHR